MASMIPKIDDVSVLELGQEGENKARTIQMDVKEWQKKWPEASIFILHLRQGEKVPYVASTSIEKNVLSWPVTGIDAAKMGVGYAEVRAVGVDGVVKKSKIIRTVVDKSISDVDSAPADPMNEWVQRLLSAAATLEVFRNAEGEEGAYMLDPTLSVAGRAADAKAVGEALATKADANNGAYDPLRSWPIGSLYITENSLSPEMLLGGKWERVQGVFLLAAGGGYDAGTSGGSAQVLLTTTNIPG